jgi:hypothetical protein
VETQVIRQLVIAVLVVGAVILAPRPARACSCPHSGWVMPEAGATGVPTDLAEILFYVDINVDEFQDNVALVTAGAPTVPLVATLLWGNVPQYRVEIPFSLVPDTTYQLFDGNALITTFTTGAGPDTEAPPALAFDELEIARRDTVSGMQMSCGNTRTGFRADVVSIGEPPAALAVTISGPGPQQDFVVPYPDGLEKLNNGFCGIRPTIEQGQEYCVELRGRDLAGNLGPPVSQCATVRACEDREDLNDGDIFECPVQGAGGCSAGNPALVVVLTAVPLIRRRSRRSLRSK